MAENGKGEFWAFVAGALTGGLLALLYAPARGEETREKIRARTEELYGRGEDLYTHFREEAEKLITDGRNRIGEVSKAGREKYEETIKSLEETGRKLEQMKEKGLQLLEELKEKVEKKEEKKPAAKSAAKKK